MQDPLAGFDSLTPAAYAVGRAVGMTGAAIGRYFGVSRQRAAQVKKLAVEAGLYRENPRERARAVFPIADMPRVHMFDTLFKRLYDHAEAVLGGGPASDEKAMRVRGLYRRTVDQVVTYDRRSGAWELVPRVEADGDLLVRVPAGEVFPDEVRAVWRRSVGEAMLDLRPGGVE